jgi:hypothetical protein
MESFVMRTSISSTSAASFTQRLPLLAGLVGLLAGTSAYAELSLPAALAGKAVVLAPTDADYARAVVTSAIKPAGQGGVSEALVIKLTQDIPVWRMWNGPAKLDAYGRTNRIGGWWAYDAPKGSAAQYRSNYEICKNWNDLTWVAKCTLAKGSVVAIGPGQSVSDATCGVSGESYAANTKDWQTYIDKPWARTTELVCKTDLSEDYEANQTNISAKK